MYLGGARGGIMLHLLGIIVFCKKIQSRQQDIKQRSKQQQNAYRKKKLEGLIDSLARNKNEIYILKSVLPFFMHTAAEYGLLTFSDNAQHTPFDTRFHLRSPFDIPSGGELLSQSV